MTRSYDKILLGVALLLLALGLFPGLSNNERKAIISTLGEADLKGSDYQPINATVVISERRKWEEPPHQQDPDAWQYFVFTPPKIYLDPQTGQLREEPSIIDPPEPPFGLKLVGMRHPIYHVQFEAYIDASTGDPNDATLMLFNRENKASDMKKVGDKIEPWGVELVDFEVKQITQEDGGIETVATLTVRDEALDRSFRLRPGEPVILQDQNLIEVEPVEPPGFPTIWKQVGDTLRNGEATYTLEEISFDKGTITVKKEAPNLEEPEVQTLSVTEKLSTPEETTKPVDDEFPKDFFNQ